MRLNRRQALIGTAGLVAGLGMGPVRGQDLGHDLDHLGITTNAQPIQMPDDIARAPGITHTNGVGVGRFVALTFDDGPHPSLTPKLLRILEKRGARATFYLIGALAKRYPDLVRRIVAEGHEIGNHTYRHPNLAQQSDGRVYDELGRTSDVIDRIVKFAPGTLRPPYGAMTARQRQMAHTRFGMPTVIWSVDTRDWQRPGSAVVADRVIRNSHNGAIVLAHDIHPPTIAAMPTAVDGLVRRGFGFLTVSEILGLEVKKPPSPLDLIALM